MTDVTAKLAECLRQLVSAHELGVLMARSGLEPAREALRMFDEAKAQPVQDLPPLPDAHWVEEFSHGTLVYTADQMHAYARAAQAATPAPAWDAATHKELVSLLCSVADNLDDGGVSPEWEEKTCRRATELLERLGELPPAATPAPVEPHVWLYDFMDGTTTVRNWSTTNKAEAFAPGNFNQRGYVPVEN